MITLDVPYSEKENAKALGATWNKELVKWQTLENTDKRFDRWLTTETEIISEAPQIIEPAEKTITLYNLLAKVKRSIYQAIPDSYWVTAEVSGITNNKHLYVDLVQYENNEQVANLRAIIWQNKKDPILSKFKEGTSSDLALGMHISIELKIGFHEKYGLNSEIVDINPGHTIGEMELKVNRIKHRLQEENIVNNNKKLATPSEYTNIAVISPESAAGLKDFMAESELLAHFNLCNFDYYTAVFQGEQANKSITDAFDAVSNNNAEYDCIVFIRGGGSKAQLHFVNEYEIAKRICENNTPVFSGIGHQIDTGIPDFVANKSFDTPSKVVNHIFTVITNNANKANNEFNRINKTTEHLIENKLQSVSHLFKEINKTIDNNIAITEVSLEQGFIKLAENIDSKIKLSALNIENKYNSLTSNALKTVDRIETKISHELISISNTADKRINVAENKIHSYYIKTNNKFESLTIKSESELKAMISGVIANNPLTVLNKGFTVVKKGTDYIGSADKLSESDDIVIKFRDGEVKASITNQNNKD